MKIQFLITLCIYFIVVHTAPGSNEWQSGTIGVTGVTQLTACDVNKDFYSDLIMVGNGTFTIAYGPDFNTTQISIDLNAVSVVCRDYANNNGGNTIIMVGEENLQQITVYEYNGSLSITAIMNDTNSLSFGHAIGIGQFDDKTIGLDLVTSYNVSEPKAVIECDFYGTRDQNFTNSPCDVIIVANFAGSTYHDEILFVDPTALGGVGEVSLWQNGYPPTNISGMDSNNQIARVVAAVNLTGTDVWGVGMTVASNRSSIQLFTLESTYCSSCDIANIGKEVSSITSILDISGDGYNDLFIAIKDQPCEVQYVPGDGTYHPSALASPETIVQLSRTGCQVTNLIDAGDTDGNGLHDLAFIENGIVHLYQFIASPTPSVTPTASITPTITPTATPTPAKGSSSMPTTTSTPSASPSPTYIASSDQSSNTDQTTVIAASAAGGGGGCMIIVIAGVIWFRMRKKKHNDSTETSDEDLDIAME